jgi:phosphatidylserine decarboxylase
MVSIFLSVFDVHVNRLPIGGRIVQSEYRPGRFLVASLERASQENEQQEVRVSNGEITVVFRMIAGLIARRIVCWKKTGDEVRRGERVGLIKFGSRVDLLLPQEVEVLVRKGARVKGGSSVIGRIR